MRNQKELLNNLIADTVAQDGNQITNFGQEGVARGMYSAMSMTLAEMSNDQTQAIRAGHVQTAVSADLDFNALKENGLTRRGATKSSVVLVFNGTAGTVIPSGTQIKTATNTIYQTTVSITLGNNNSIQRPLLSNYLGDCVIAESIETGSKTKVRAKELTALVNAITGVTVTNLFESTGGLDSESDDEFRIRIYQQADIYPHGTQGFFEALAKQANSDVIRTKAVYNAQKGGVDLYVVKNSLADFSAAELLAIENYVYDRQRALTPVKAYNTQKTGIAVDIYCTINDSVNFETLFTTTATKIVEFVNPLLLYFGSTVKQYDLFIEMLKIDGYKQITALTLNGAEQDITADTLAVPVLTTLAIHNLLNDKTVNLTQKYLVV